MADNVNDIAGTVDDIKQQLSEFIAREKELAKAEIVPSAKKAGVGSVLAVLALAFALHAVWMLVIALAAVFAWLVSLTGLSTALSIVFGFLIAAVISLIVAGILGLLGYRKFKKVKAPTATIAEFKATLSALVDGFTKGEKGLPVRAPGAPGFIVVDDKSA
jgi:tetrahydromethanopterin S-methyltransferase subunit F